MMRDLLPYTTTFHLRKSCVCSQVRSCCTLQKKKSSRVQGHVSIQACSHNASRPSFLRWRHCSPPAHKRASAGEVMGSSGSCQRYAEPSGGDEVGMASGEERVRTTQPSSPSLHLTSAAPAASLRRFNFQRGERRGKKGAKRAERGLDNSHK